MKKFNYKCHIQTDDNREGVNFQVLQINSKQCSSYGWGDVRFADVARERQVNNPNSNSNSTCIYKYHYNIKFNFNTLNL